MGKYPLITRQSNLRWTWTGGEREWQGKHSVAVLLLLLGLSSLTEECPSACECKWRSGKEAVTCVKAKLTDVPPGLDFATQLLNLSGNVIHRLKENAFLSKNLLNLQRICLSDCQLLSLDKLTFASLTNLIELDLSSNGLQFVPTHTFGPIAELRELKMSENPVKRIGNEAFLGLPRLVRLEMTNCHLESIEADGFRGLSSLEWLRLDNNRLFTVQAGSFFPLRSLHGVELNGNPWNCTCPLQQLREWMEKNNVPFGVPPVCLGPPRLEGKSWDQLQIEDFACLPKVENSSEKDRIRRVLEGTNATLLCQLQATPDTQVRWYHGAKGLVSNGSLGLGGSLFLLQESFVWDEPGGVLLSPSRGDPDRSLGIKISQLTLIRVTGRDGGLYICRAESRAGSVAANFTLLVLQNKAEFLTGKVMIITGALATGLVIIVGYLLLVCIIVVGKRRPAAHRTSEEEEEKMEMNHERNGRGSQRHVHAESNGTNGGGGALDPNGVIWRDVCGSPSGDYRDYRAIPTVDPEEEETFFGPSTRHHQNNLVIRGGKTSPNTMSQNVKSPAPTDSSKYSDLSNFPSYERTKSLPRPTRNPDVFPRGSRTNLGDRTASESPLLHSSSESSEVGFYPGGRSQKSPGRGPEVPCGHPGEMSRDPPPELTDFLDYYRLLQTELMEMTASLKKAEEDDAEVVPPPQKNSQEGYFTPKETSQPHQLKSILKNSQNNSTLNYYA